MTNFSATLQFNFVTVERRSKLAKYWIEKDRTVLMTKIKTEEIPLKP